VVQHALLYFSVPEQFGPKAPTSNPDSIGGIQRRLPRSIARLPS